MHAFPAFTVTLEFGTRRRGLGSPELSDATRHELTKLLLQRPAASARPPRGKEGEGGGWVSSPLPGTTENERDRNRFPSVVSGRGKEEGSGEEPSGRDEDDVQSLASYLADALDDRRSLRWYELVARTVPEEVIHRALTRALDFRREEVRRSRAAYFTAIVKPFVPRRRKTR